MAGFDFESLLRVDEALGVPADFNVPTRPTPAISASGLEEVQKLLTPSQHRLFRMMDDGEKSMDVHYYVEREGAEYTTQDVRTTKVLFPSAPTGVRAPVYASGEERSHTAVSTDQARQNLEHAQSNTNTARAVGAMHQFAAAHVLARGCSLEYLFTKWWSIILDTHGGATHTVDLDASTMHALLTQPPTPATANKDVLTLPGVRVATVNYSELGRAMWLIGCQAGQLAGSAQLSRYDWLGIPVTFYGALQANSRVVQLTGRDCSLMVGVVLQIAQDFNQHAECARGLRTAMVMIGSPTTAKYISLDVPVPRVCDHVHRIYSSSRMNTDLGGLASQRLRKLANLVGLGYAQCMGQAVRSLTLAFNMRDVDGMDHVMHRHQSTSLLRAGSMLGIAWDEVHGTSLCHAEMLAKASTRWTATSGILAGLIVGMRLPGAMTDLTAPITLQTYDLTRPSDNPSLGKLRSVEATNWLLLHHCITDAGATLNMSRAGLEKAVNNNMRLHAHTRLFAGTTAQLVVIGPGGTASLEVEEDNGDLQFSPPPRPNSTSEPVTEDALSIQQVIAAHIPKDSGDEDWLLEALEQRGEVINTRMRVKGPTRAPPPPPTPIEVQLTADSANFASDLKTGLRPGWGPQPTSGEGLECGARALHTSLAQLDREYTEPGSLDRVRTALRNTMTNLEPTLAPLLEDQWEERNFTVDQLAIAAQHLGYDLRVIEAIPGTNQHRVTAHGDPNLSNDQVIVYHNGLGHWESIGPSSRPLVTTLGMARATGS